MLSLSNLLTVPQIFINNQHIGGADDTLNLLKGWDDDDSNGMSPLEIYEKLVANHADPTDPRLRPTTDGI